MPTKTVVIETLTRRVAELTDHNATMRESIRVLEGEKRQAEETAKAIRAKFADLKQRLQTAESENQRMRGYLARVQEDDVVREELLTVGEPEGEQYLRPKRKHASFDPPNDFTEFKAPDNGLYSYHDRRKAERKHWIIY